MTVDHLNINENFKDLHKPLNHQQALEESDRCLYCYDAPCIQACPTSIDIPTFIHQIRSDNTNGAALSILNDNILGGTCARVCPTEILCQDVCVLNVSIQKPVEIGLLQRFAVDSFMSQNNKHPFKRMSTTGKTIAVIGAGPAGLSCAHKLATFGHDVTIYEAKEKSGGLNEYGLAAYKMVDDFAQKEINFLLEIGGITIINNQKFGVSISLETLQKKHDAIFISIGLGATNSLGLAKENVEGIHDAVDIIENIRQTQDLSTLKTGNDVIVIGAGNTAIDAAVQAKKLGANNVTLIYRKSESGMNATKYEIDLARKNGVNIKLWLTPTKIIADEHIAQLECTATKMQDGQLVLTPFKETIECDLLLKAIGQKLNTTILGEIKTSQGKITINDDYQTNILGVYAGGDAIKSGEDLTVQAVEDGKRAALAMDKHLRGEV